MIVDWSISNGAALSRPLGTRGHSDAAPPKFWLGDRVSLKTVAHRIGTVHGLEWREQAERATKPPGGNLQARSHGEFYGRCGWWCRVCWDGSSALMGLHEDSLELEGLR